MTDTSGPTCGKQFAYYDPDSQSWKMWPATGLWGSIEYSETWPRTGYMSDGQAFELPTSVPHTTGNGFSSSYLPTPTAAKAGNDLTLTKSGDGREVPNKLGWAIATVTEGRLLPTPRTTDSHGPGRHGTGGQDLRTVVAETWTGDPMPPLFDMEE